MLTRSNSSINIFLSHAWDVDSLGRSTHQRAKLLNGGLKKLGWKLWFDEEKLLLGSNIDAEMARGIERSDAICLCITKKYIEKINSQIPGDNCAKEFNLSFVSGKRILPLIFELEMLDIRNWPRGVAQMYLAHTLYVDCTGDIQCVLTKLSQMLLLIGLTPSRTFRPGILHHPPRSRSRNIRTCIRI